MNINTIYDIDQKVYYLKQIHSEIGNIEITEDWIKSIHFSRDISIRYVLDRSDKVIKEEFLFVDEIELMKFFKSNLRAKIGDGDEIIDKEEVIDVEMKLMKMK